MLHKYLVGKMKALLQAESCMLGNSRHTGESTGNKNKLVVFDTHHHKLLWRQYPGLSFAPCAVRHDPTQSKSFPGAVYTQNTHRSVHYAKYYEASLK